MCSPKWNIQYILDIFTTSWHSANHEMHAGKRRGSEILHFTHILIEDVDKMQNLHSSGNGIRRVQYTHE